MEIKDCIKVYDNVIPWAPLSNLIRYAASCSDFEHTKVGNDPRRNNEIRKADGLNLNNTAPSMTNVHWFCFLHNFFNQGVNRYHRDLNLAENAHQAIIDINILKYKKEGHYIYHHDDAVAFPRTISCILLLNNDYKGGELCFRDPDQSNEMVIEVKPNRMIIWPSNFLYPHTVKPVTEGTRYSVVAWAR